MNILQSSHVLRLKSRLIAAVAAAALGGVGAAQAAPTYQQTNLVTDDQDFLASQGFTPAAFEDPNCRRRVLYEPRQLLQFKLELSQPGATISP